MSFTLYYAYKTGLNENCDSKHVTNTIISTTSSIVLTILFLYYNMENLYHIKYPSFGMKN